MTNLLTIEACIIGIRRVAPDGAVVSLCHEVTDYPNGREEQYIITVGWPGHRCGICVKAATFPDAVRLTVDQLLHRRSITNRILAKVRGCLAKGN